MCGKEKIQIKKVATEILYDIRLTFYDFLSDICAR